VTKFYGLFYKYYLGDSGNCIDIVDWLYVGFFMYVIKAVKGDIQNLIEHYYTKASELYRVSVKNGGSDFIAKTFKKRLTSITYILNMRVNKMWYWK